MSTDPVDGESIDGPRKYVEIPFNSSVIFIAILALASPLATTIWELYSLHFVHQDPNVHRFLEDNICFINATAAGQSAPPESTMTAIATTLVIAMTIGGFALVLYEAYRRDPIVGKYVYDRKRLTQPNRTPPPLMLSRSLWRGSHQDGNEVTRSASKWGCAKICFKAPPALFELFFLTLDENYLNYSKAANEARIERERRGNYSCCRTGCYHNNCCNTFRVRNSQEAMTYESGQEYVDQDGYVYYPGFNHEYDFIHDGENRFEIPKLSRSSVSASASTGGASIVSNAAKKWKSSLADLYPEDFRSSGVGHTELDFSVSLKSTGGASTVSNAAKKWKSSIADLYPEDIRSSGVGHTELDFSVSLKSDLSDAYSPGLGADLVPPEKPEEEQKAMHDSIIDECSKTAPEKKSIGSSLNLENVEEDNHKEYTRVDNSDKDKLASNFHYPCRLSFFLPPGFHVWSDAFDYFKEFFFIPKCLQLFHLTRDALFASNTGVVQDQSRYNRAVLSPAEEELLRCAGLDTYLMIRFARFGFDVCFYPFIFACVTVIPIYLSCDIETIFDMETEGLVSTATVVIDGVFTLTVNRIESGSSKMVWILFFSFFLYFFVLRRLWLEWEVVIKLRHRFLANGDENFHENPTYLQKYRNTCIVECVPLPQRSDRNVRLIFEKLFPKQIENAEMLIDTIDLEAILDKRRNFIEKYEDAAAKYEYDSWKYHNQQKNKNRARLHEPEEPEMRPEGCCRCFGKNVASLPFYKDSIEECNSLADKEYNRIVESRIKWRDNVETKSQSSEGRPARSSDNLFTLLLPKMARKRLGLVNSDFFCGTSMVEFKSIATKQSAVQCNLSGEPHWMITKDAPDPRDILWQNVTAEHRLIENRKVIVEFFLVFAILTWGAFVTLVTNAANSSIDNIQKADPFNGINNQEPLIVGVLRGYLPALIISLILLWMPGLLFYLAITIIKFKSLSKCDEFVIKWSTAFRLANIFFTFFAISLVQAIQCLKDDPENFIKRVAEGVLRQSSFLLKLIIIATGQETMLQLLQWRSLIKQAICRPLTNFNSRSKRYLDWLNKAPPFEQSFIFGFFSPVLSYCLIIGMLYSYMAPIMLGSCSFFFWVATKVHTHNALFIYCQPFEGGGKIFYYWNRIVFVSLYSSILIFFGILVFKQFAKMSIAFFIIMMLVTYMVDKAITSTFVIHSLNLPMTMARTHDEEEVALLERSSIKKDGGENFMYRHPMLNQMNWDTKPFRWM